MGSDLITATEARLGSPLMDTVTLLFSREALFSLVDLMNLNRMVSADGKHRLRWSLRDCGNGEYALDNAIWTLEN